MAATSAPRVDSSNKDQLRAWDGDEGAYWADHADYFDRSVAAYHRRLLDQAAIQTARPRARCRLRHRADDPGRGSRRHAGSALGVDLSSRMLDHARRRAAEEGLANATFAQADAQVHAFEPASFDVAISRTSAMFFGDHVAAFRNVGSALRPGGRLLLVTWQSLAGNEWLREISRALSAGRDLPAPPPDAGPFALSDPGRVRSLLTEAGFTDITLDGMSAGLWFGNDADDAHQFTLGLMGWMLEGPRRRRPCSSHRRAPRHDGRPRHP